MTHNLVNYPVLLPVIRRVMPNIIASQIIGVSPMTGPVGNISTLRTRYGLTTGWEGRVVFEKEHFNHFLRVYNRRWRHHPEYLTALGYPHVKLLVPSAEKYAADQWCSEVFKPGSWVRTYADFWFANKDDATMFAMRWL